MLYALASILNEIRPVQLWATMTYGGGSGDTASGNPRLQQHAVRLDTSPFDVARIAGVLMHADLCAMYASDDNTRQFGRYGHGWAYGIPNLEKKWAGEILGRIVHPGTTVLYIPAAHLYDDRVSTPTDWLKAQLTKYAGDIIEAA